MPGIPDDKKFIRISVPVKLEPFIEALKTAKQTTSSQFFRYAIIEACRESGITVDGATIDDLIIELAEDDRRRRENDPRRKLKDEGAILD
ncbi:hypothetical protein [Heliophilum fasciatum]|uniref:Uncharacterized protein n=1 Tax=Heliophilum fasciatum TaxID=35700 RepID=A0A4R2RG97_9FIRM|nr:hypothetical protein [Heliophilum fasciatum]MCW2279019.1 hypothetical protein [Heliophilum fasciatum]TCP61744.1 hypothetical protein EDD73_12615 [Heliophilum fasciatum]